MLVTANQEGIDVLKARGAKPEIAARIYLDSRGVWFEFKRGMKSKKKSTRALYASKLREFYDGSKILKKLFTTYVEFRSFLNQYPPVKTVTTSQGGQDRQRNGFDFDRRVAADLASSHLATYTSAGSRSAFDVIAIPKGNKRTVFAQCKLNRRLDTKDVKALSKFLSKAPKWAEVRIYFEQDKRLAYAVLRNENDLAWFQTTSQAKRESQGLREPKTVIAQQVVESSTPVDFRALMLRLKWTGRVGAFSEFYRSLEKLWPEVLGCRYNLAKCPAVDKKFSKLFKMYESNFGVQKYVVFKTMRIREFEPRVQVTKTAQDFHREHSGKTEYTALKNMTSGASYICRTDRTSTYEIAHVIRVRGDKLELAFCRASGLISKSEHAKLKLFLKQLPGYASIRFYFYVNGKKAAYKDLARNLDWFLTQRGVDLRVNTL